MNWRALELARGLPANPKNLDRVARESDARTAQWAFTQWELRKRAAAKQFPRAEELLYTREALEQATHFALATYHASLFPKGALVADLTCGIGSDLIALAGRGPVRGYEIDAERFECALHNLQTCGFEGQVLNADCRQNPWDFHYAIADPSRRVAGKRTANPDEFAPNPEELAVRMKDLRLGLIKLSPLLPDPFLARLGTGLQFVSYGGECREALVICGSEAPSGRWAVKIGEAHALPEAAVPRAEDSPEDFLYEADPAAIRAHAMGSIPGADSMAALGDSNGYLTSRVHSPSPWVKKYRVLASGRFDAKEIKVRLRELGRRCTIVKSRAPGIDADELLKKVRSEGDGDSVLVLFPVQKSLRYAIVEPEGTVR